MSLEKIRFQKLSLAKFSDIERKDLVNELRRRKISFRLTTNGILFDEKYLKQVKDLVPPSLR